MPSTIRIAANAYQRSNQPKSPPRARLVTHTRREPGSGGRPAGPPGPGGVGPDDPPPEPPPRCAGGSGGATPSRAMTGASLLALAAGFRVGLFDAAIDGRILRVLLERLEGELLDLRHRL